MWWIEYLNGFPFNGPESHSKQPRKSPRSLTAKNNDVPQRNGPKNFHADSHGDLMQGSLNGTHFEGETNLIEIYGDVVGFLL